MSHQEHHRRFVHAYQPGHGHWLWHQTSMPSHHPHISADRLLDRLAESHMPPAQQPAPPVTEHPLTWLEDEHGLDAWQRLAEGR